MTRRAIVCILIIGVSALLSLHEAARLSPFRSRKSPSELINVYEVISPRVSYGSQLSPEGHPMEIHVRLQSEEDEYQLDLYLNKYLLSPSFASGYHDGEKKHEETHENCFYHGKVKGHHNWDAVFSTCYGLRGWFGNLDDQSNLYHIEPIEEITELTSPHALYMDSEHKNNKQGTCGTKREHNIVQNLPDLEPVVKSQDSQVLRKRQATDTMIVEWLIVNDYYQYINYNSNITAVVLRAIELANHVDMLYKVLGIRVALVYSMTWTTSQLILETSDASTILSAFQTYHRDNTDLREIVHDSAMLITGIDVDGPTVGQAFLNRMCVYESSVGFSQDSGSSINSLGGIAAHELGHIFNMDHDDAASCDCPDTNGCIMNAILGFPPPTQFSQCSRDELAIGLDQGGGDVCLDNNPTTLVGDPVCGNGIKEPGEVCDCGSVQECQDPCCNATTCMISDGNECAEGVCCTSDCKFKEYGTTCRESGGECGIAEYCSGLSAECSRDVYKQNGVSCENNNSYCYDGSCVSLNGQCELYYGEASQASVEECYTTYNTRGVQLGHCGTANNAFIACTQQNARCGLIHCDGGEIMFDNIVFTSTLSYITRSVSVNNTREECSTFSTGAEADSPSPGLVREGTKCGDGMLCISQQCVSLNSLPVTSCPTGSNGEICSGNGVCSNLDTCSCNVGYNGSDCSRRVGSSRRRSNAGAVAGGVIGTLLFLILLGAVIVVVVVLVLKFGSNLTRKSYSPDRNTSSQNGQYAMKTPDSQTNGYKKSPVTTVNNYVKRPPPSPAGGSAQTRSRPPPPSRTPPTNNSKQVTSTPPSRPAPPTSRPTPPTGRPTPPINARVGQSKPPPRPPPQIASKPSKLPAWPPTH